MNSFDVFVIEGFTVYYFILARRVITFSDAKRLQKLEPSDKKLYCTEDQNNTVANSFKKE